jgi:hypothetical protein
VHPHHIDPRWNHGPDDPWNIVTLCPACHLRGIHSGRMWVERVGDWLVWSWPDGSSAIMHSPVGR